MCLMMNVWTTENIQVVDKYAPDYLSISDISLRWFIDLYSIVKIYGSYRSQGRYLVQGPDTYLTSEATAVCAR